MTFARTAARHFVPALSVLLFACLPSTSHAALSVVSTVNTTSTYNATVDWTLGTAPFTIDTLGCSDAAPVLTLTCTPWMPVQLQGIQFAQAPGAGQVSLTMQHLLGPHGIDVNPGTAGGLLVSSVSPGVGSGFVTVYTTHNPHFDRLTLSVDAISAGLSRITITGDHPEVPEPSTLGLGAFGGAAMLLVRRLRRRNS